MGNIKKSLFINEWNVQLAKCLGTKLSTTCTVFS